MIRSLLIVDDEKKDRDKIRKIIEASEVEVEKIFECSNGKEALDIAYNNRVPFIDVIIVLLSIARAKPKSHILIIPDALINTFWGFISLCIILLLCK